MLNRPLDLGGFERFEWEDIMACLDKSSHKDAHIVKYKLQCRIDAAILRGEW